MNSVSSPVYQPGSKISAFTQITADPKISQVLWILIEHDFYAENFLGLFEAESALGDRQPGLPLGCARRDVNSERGSDTPEHRPQDALQWMVDQQISFVTGTPPRGENVPYSLPGYHVPITKSRVGFLYECDPQGHLEERGWKVYYVPSSS